MTVILIFLVISTTSVFSVPLPNPDDGCVYQLCHPTDPSRINVHLVPHSHDDVGWLKTVDQMYWGSPGAHGEYSNAGVQFIITSTVDALKRNPDRRYIQVETEFFYQWWNQQDDDSRADFINLVKSGQLEMVNGAWSMNDEAAAHYVSIIEGFTWGLGFINDTIGNCAKPKIGWQIDPFGHSREHASIISQLGFDALIIGRIDMRDKEKRRRSRSLDFIWQTSANFENSNLFTSMFPDMYGTMGGFCFDITCTDESINDNPASPGYNLDRKIADFVTYLNGVTDFYPTSNLLIPMGGDFHFQAAEMNYMNLDKIVKTMKNHEKYNVIYSTPSCYVKAVNEEAIEEGLKFTLKTDDFFPYASDSHSFWTGYYTSRPSTKRFERYANNLLQAAKQLATFSRVDGINIDETIAPLRRAIGIMQHHDAISGTEKQAVADDYMRILTEAIRIAEKPVGVTLGTLLRKDKDSQVDLKLSTCLLANVTICDPINNADRFLVTVYNPYSTDVTHYVRLPVQEGAYKVTGPDGEEDNDVLDPITSFEFIPGVIPFSKELLFAARDVPALGVKLYYVQKTETTSENVSNDVPKSVQDELVFGTETNGFTIDSDTLLLKSVTLSGQSLDVSQQFFYYNSFSGENNDPEVRSSGAYVFRPTSDGAHPIPTEMISYKSQKGTLVDEFSLTAENDAFGKVYQTIRVYKRESDPYIELDWMIGDIQCDSVNQLGKEFVSRFTVLGFNNKGTFYTDSNGRETIRRERDKRLDYEYDPTEEPVASNYYPVSSKISIKDEDQKLQFSILNDRAQGGSSLVDGSLEVMVHRRILRDDAFGLSEALNEVQYNRGLYARGQHYLVFGSTETSVEDGISTTAFERGLAQKKFSTPWVLVADASTGEFDTLEKVQDLLNFKFQGLLKELPPSVQILSLEPWKDDSYILRIEHYIENNEDDNLSKDVNFNIEALFSKFSIAEIQETTLAANQLLEELAAEKKYTWAVEEKQLKKTKPSPVAADPRQITLSPMQIRTFLIKVGDPRQDSKGGGFGIIIRPSVILLLSVFELLFFILM